VPGALSRTIRVFIIDDHRMFTQAVAAALTEEPDMEVVGPSTTWPTRGASWRRSRWTSSCSISASPTAGHPCGRRAARDPPGPRSSWSPRRWTQASSTRPWPPVARASSPRATASTRSPRRSGQPAGGHARLAGHAQPADERRPNGSSLTEPLTPRETAVLLFLADGLGNEEISRRLFISIHTLRNHIQSIISKLGAHSKLEAVSIAIREGLITAPGNDY